MTAKNKNEGPICGAKVVDGCLGTAHPHRPVAVAFSAREDPDQALRRYAGLIVCSACAEVLEAAGLTLVHAHRCRTDGCGRWTAGSLCDVHFKSQNGHGKNGHGKPDVSPVLAAYKAAEKAKKAEAREAWEAENGWVEPDPEPVAPTAAEAEQDAALARTLAARGHRAPGLTMTRAPLCGFCGRQGHDRSGCPDKNGPRGKNKNGEKDEKKNGHPGRHPGKQKNHA